MSGAPTPSRPFRIRLSQLAWLLVACAAVAGFVVTSWHRGPKLVQVPTASRAIAAYTVVDSTELHMTWIPSNRIPAQSLRALPDGHRVTLVALAADAPIPSASLGPDAGDQSGHLLVTGAQLTAAAALNGSLRPGDRVTVSATGSTAVAREVLVIQVAKTSEADRPYAVTFGFAGTPSPQLLQACGAGTIAVLRT
jgi:hypothetical protein